MNMKLILDIARVKENPDDIGVLAKITVSDEVVQEFRLQWKFEKGKCNLVASKTADEFITSMKTLCKIAQMDVNDLVQAVQEAVESIDGKFCETSDETPLGTTVVHPIRRVFTISEPRDCSLSKTFSNSKEFGFLKNLHDSLEPIVNHDKKKKVKEISVDINFVSDNIKDFEFVDQPVEYPETFEVYNINYCITYEDETEFKGSYMFANSMTVDEEKDTDPTFREEDKFNLFLKKSTINGLQACNIEGFVGPCRPRSCMATFIIPPKNTLFLVEEESSPYADLESILIGQPTEIENSTTTSSLPLYSFFTSNS